MAPGVREGVTEADSRDGSAPEPRGLSFPGSPGGGRAAETGWPWLGLFEVSGTESQAPPGWGDWGPTAVQDGTFEWGRGRAALARGAVPFEAAPRPPHPGRLGWPATGGPSVLLARQGCAGAGCPASQEPPAAGVRQRSRAAEEVG